MKASNDTVKDGAASGHGARGSMDPQRRRRIMIIAACAMIVCIIAGVAFAVIPGWSHMDFISTASDKGVGPQGAPVGTKNVATEGDGDASAKVGSSSQGGASSNGSQDTGDQAEKDGNVILFSDLSNDTPDSKSPNESNGNGGGSNGSGGSTTTGNGLNGGKDAGGDSGDNGSKGESNGSGNDNNGPSSKDDGGDNTAGYGPIS